MKIPKAIRELQLKVQRTQTPAFQKKVMKFLFNHQGFKKLIIDLNTKDQLYKEGIDSNGISLKEYTRNFGYSDRTIKEKNEKGQPTDRITLNDTGAFYNSFRVKLFSDELMIFANPIKDGDNLFDDWGTDIVGLTDENLNTVVQYAKIILLPELKKYFLKGKQSQLN